jgi:hypothetical protein
LVATAIPLFLILLDRLLEVRLAKRQHACAAQSAQHDGTDHAVIAFCGLFHVEENQAFRLGAHQIRQAFLIYGTLSHRALLADCVGSMRGCNESRTIGGHQTALNCAASLGKL